MVVNNAVRDHRAVRKPFEIGHFDSNSTRQKTTHSENSSHILEKSVHKGNLIISHQFNLSNQIEMSATSHHVLCCLLSGLHTRKVTKIGERKYLGNIRRGDICIKPTDYSGFWSWEEPDDSLVFSIKPNFLRQIASENDFLNPDGVELLPVLNSNDEQLNNLAVLFQRELNHGQEGSLMYLESLSNVLGVHLLRHYCKVPATEKVGYREGLPAYKMKQVIDYINAHLADEISLGELANQVKLSQSHFSALFRKSAGQSPYKFLTETRINRAKQLLLTTDMTIAEVAVNVGFCDQSHLSRHMRRLLNLSPRQVREQA